MDKAEVENKGIIKDRKKHLKVLLDVRECAEGLGWTLLGLVASPLTGQKGNREFLIHLSQDSELPGINEEQINAIVNEGESKTDGGENSTREN